MPDSFLHNVPHMGFGQGNNARCWYASYCMILKYLGRNVNEVKDRLEPKIDFEDAYAKGLFPADYRVTANALNFKILDTNTFRKPQTFFDVGLSDGAEAFLKELEWQPLWVSRYSSAGVYHVTVAVGYDDKQSDIIFHNPYPGPNDARGNLTEKANTYVKFITQQIGSVQMPV